MREPELEKMRVRSSWKMEEPAGEPVDVSSRRVKNAVLHDLTLAASDDDDGDAISYLCR